jgi:hypothetical protein
MPDMNEKFYVNHLLPLVRKAGSRSRTQEIFISWLKSNRERANKYAGIEWDVREFDTEDWQGVLSDAAELL